MSGPERKPPPIEAGMKFVPSLVDLSQRDLDGRLKVLCIDYPVLLELITGRVVLQDIPFDAKVLAVRVDEMNTDRFLFKLRSASFDHVSRGKEIPQFSARVTPAGQGGAESTPPTT